MNAPAQQKTEKPAPVIGLASAGLLMFAGCAIGIVLYLRVWAASLDHAIVNAATAGLFFFAWLLVSCAFWMSAAPRRLWRSVFFAPIVGAIIFFAFYKVKRVDGELVPQFTSRWAKETALPDVTADIAPVAESSDEAEMPQWLQVRSSDFPQFLGPNRDGTLPDMRLAKDWQGNAPEIKWKQPIGAGWSGFAVQGDLAVTMEQRDEEEWVTAYDIRDGKLIWKYVIPGLHFHPMGGVGPRSTPSIDDSRVYAQSAVSDFVCLDLVTGKQLWTKELLDGPQEEFEKKVSWGRSSSPLIVGNTVVVASGGVADDAPALIAFDKDTGEEVYRAGKGLQISYSSPTLATLGGVSQILYTSEDKISGFDAETGELLWQHDAPGFSSSEANCSQPVAIDAKRVLVTKGYGRGAKVIEVTRPAEGAKQTEQWQTQVIWKKESLLKTKFTSAVLRDGYAYGLSDGILECVDVENGKRMWKRGRYRQGQTLLVGDVLLVTSESGQAVLVDATPEEFRELSSLQVIGNVSWNTAAISGDRLLMRNADEMACVILPTEDENDLASAPIDATQGRSEGEQ